jgi:hypothetical protein
MLIGKVIKPYFIMKPMAERERENGLEVSNSEEMEVGRML